MNILTLEYKFWENIPNPTASYVRRLVIRSTDSDIDYQNELVAVWSERVKTDTTGILEKTIQHSWGCSCCTQDPEYLARKKYYKRKSKGAMS